TSGEKAAGEQFVAGAEYDAEQLRIGQPRRTLAEDPFRLPHESAAVQRICQRASEERVSMPDSQNGSPVRECAVQPEAIARLEPRAEGEERLDLVVRLAQPRRERANERPEELVGEVLVEEHQLLQIGFLDRVQRARHL